MTTNDFWKKQWKDHPTADQINKHLGNHKKRKLTTEEKKKRDAFLAVVKKRQDNYINKHYKG